MNFCIILGETQFEYDIQYVNSTTVNVSWSREGANKFNLEYVCYVNSTIAKVLSILALLFLSPKLLINTLSIRFLFVCLY